MKDKLKISVVIPVFNSEETIEILVASLMSELKVYPSYEIILINDCSDKDNSYQKCIRLSESNQVIKFLELSRNFGEHNAVMAGLNFCSGTIAVIMDDDFQHSPSDIHKLINEIKNGSDVVFSRYIEKKHNIFRNLGSKFNNFVATLLMQKPSDLYLSSFKAINRFTINEVIKYSGPFPYIDGLILRFTRNYSTVLTGHSERESGTSGYTLSKLIGLWLNMFVNFSITPLRLATSFGIVIALLSFIFITFVIINKFFYPHEPMGWASLISAVLFLGGVQLLTIGILGEYLGKLFMSQVGQPQFVIREKKNLD